MFRAINLPIFRSTRLCVTACGIMYPRCCRCLVLLKMGKLIARNMLSWLELLISRCCCIWLVVCIIYISLYFFETFKTISIYSSTQCRVFHNVTFFGSFGQRHAPAALPPGKTRYPLCRSLGGPQGRSGQVRKILPPTGSRSPGLSSL